MRILLIRLSSFGDIVFTLPLAQILFSHVPGVEIGWAVERSFAGLLEGAAFVQHSFFATTRAWRKAPFSRAARLEFLEFVSRVRAFSPDAVIDAHGLFKSSWATFLTPATRKIGFGPGTAGEWLNCLATDEWVEARERPHSTDRAVALAEHFLKRSLPAPHPDVQHLVNRPDEAVDHWLAGRQGKPFVLLLPFASRRDKEWENQEIRHFAMRVEREFGFGTVIKWGPGERERAEWLCQEAPDILELAPLAGPAATARLASRAFAAVGADTGPTHLAAATGSPTLALFGPTDPARFGPRGERARALVNRKDYNAAGAKFALPFADDAVDALASLVS